MQAALWGISAKWRRPQRQAQRCRVTQLADVVGVLVLLPASLLIVVEDIVSKVVLGAVQQPLAPRLLPEPCPECHEQD